MAVTLALAATAVLLLFLFGCHIGARVEAVSHTWGYVNKYATPLYDKEVRLAAGDAARRTPIELTFPDEGCSNDYTITAVHAFDMQTGTEGGDEVPGDSPPAVVVRGGIGFNYTTLRFNSEMPIYQLADGIRFRVVIYGVDL